MKRVLPFIGSFFTMIGKLLLLFWELVKFIFSKVWKFILLIGGLILGISTIKKATKEE